MSDSNYENRVFHETLTVNGSLPGFDFGSFQITYQLTEADFYRLKQNENKLSSISSGLLFTTLGYGLSILPKFTKQIANQGDAVPVEEWIPIAIGIFLSAIIHFSGRCMKGERQVIMEKIETHFDQSPAKTAIFQGKK